MSLRCSFSRRVSAVICRALAAGGGALVLCGCLQLSGLGEWLEQRSLDWRFRLRPTPTVAAPVTLVVLRGERHQTEDLTLRAHLSYLLETLTTLPSPRAVVVDIRLATPDERDRGTEGLASRIVQATQTLGRVVHAFDIAGESNSFRSVGAQAQLDPHLRRWQPGTEAVDGSRDQAPAADWLPPLLAQPHVRAAHATFGTELFGAAAGAGFTNVWPAPSLEDPIVRSLQLLQPFQPLDGFNAAGGVPYYSSLALAGTATALANPAGPGCRVLPTDGFSTDRLLRESPLQEEARLRINFRRRFALRADTDSDSLSSRPDAGGDSPPDVLLFHACSPGESDPGDTSATAGAPGADPTSASTPPPGAGGASCGVRAHWFSRPGDARPLEQGTLARWLPCQVLLIVDGHEQNVVRGPLGPDFPQASLHAQVISNLLESDVLRFLPRSAGMGLALLLPLLVALVWRPAPTWRIPGEKHARSGGGRAGTLSSRLRGGLRGLVNPATGTFALWSGAAIWSHWQSSLALPLLLPLAGLAGGQLGQQLLSRWQARQTLLRLLQATEARSETEEMLQTELTSLQQVLEAESVQRQQIEAELDQARRAEGELSQTLDETRRWAEEARLSREELTSRHRRVEEREAAHLTELAKLQAELNQARAPEQWVELQARLEESRRAQVALEAEATALRTALEEAQTLEALAQAQSRAADQGKADAEARATQAEQALTDDGSLTPEQTRLLEQVDQTLLEAMKLSRKLARPVERIEQVLARPEKQRASRKQALLASEASLREGVRKLQELQTASERDGESREKLRQHLLERQSLYRASQEQVRAILEEAGALLERLAPPGAPIQIEPEEEDGRRVGGAFLTTNPALIRLFEQELPRLAQSDLPVLILGETGTGKELVAQALHRLSRRPGKLKDINCAAIPEPLLEAELFGHVRGAFTGAVGERRGLCEEAQDGTLFLDELGRLPGALQGKLLRVLDNGRIRRVGSNTDVEVRFRLVAATSTDLEAQVREGTFLQDLYYRIRGLVVELPPLRSRLGDTTFLAQAFLRQEARATGRPLCWTPEALVALSAWPWPGNVRELRNTVRALVVLSRQDLIDAAAVWSQLDVKDASSADLQDFTAQEQARLALFRRLDFDIPRCAREPGYQVSRSTADRHFRVLICKALLLQDWDVTDAARLLAGSTGSALIPAVQRRICHFLGENLLSNLERIRAATPDGDAERLSAQQEWESALRDQYRADFPLVQETLRALREGRLRGFESSHRPPPS